MHSTITPFALPLPLPLALGLLLSLGAVAQGCESYGVDFQNGGSYFQNISSADPFTFVSIYDNCEADRASNLLISPAGDEYLCSETELQPDDVERVSTCPLSKNQMLSGPWAVLIISNNGVGEPIAYERDFELVVGVPVTTTFTPTISVTVTSTPLSTTTSLTTTTTTTTVTSTTVLPAETKTPTVTVTPTPVTTTKVFGPTLKLTAYEISPILTTTTTTKTCTTSKQPYRDPTLTWRPATLPTQLSQVAAVLDLTAARDLLSRRRDTPLGRRVPADRAQRIAERKERIAIEKRAPDLATTTITDTNTADWITSTSTAVAPTATIIITSVMTQTQVTTTINTLYSGTTTLPPQTTILPTKTITKLKPTIFTTTVTTITKKPLYTITVPKNDPAATKACSLKGGHMV